MPKSNLATQALILCSKVFGHQKPQCYLDKYLGYSILDVLIKSFYTVQALIYMEKFFRLHKPQFYVEIFM